MLDPRELIRGTLAASDRLVNTYISDLDDAELLVRPLEGMNHIAWQLGHLILTERMVMEAIRPGSCPPVPEGFEAGHGRQQFTEDDPAKFLPRARYQELWRAQRDATLAVLDGLSDAELAAPAPEPMRPLGVQSNGAAISFMGGHATLHAGQFTAVRRKLGKPILI